uniref:Large ribosomal subunit protein uL4c n=1 Tax=Gracilaria tenuistipitata var. liui TaxID=285951 RepID=RK4_GRATL|nr:ribosomal protein L4 [Gracilaria tenuistipitata var. liui]Q6B8V4.1 RecName: Full=Large ribosomal subunit protein uL4c; AltName: Full=50S ribosomal protein L4, chloroplastic [Gracilaria tenuistipitata var. liui]AAT79681.1 50S ribosomal protein L4 [Gracilaria tenuistipitata var. liui]
MNIKKKLIYSIISSKDTKEKESEEIVVKLSKQSNKKIYILHRALIHQLSNHRNRNAHTQTRGEVSGGGRKPWKQKGTGRARAGSNRSPLWRGGGVIFGPRHKKYVNKINKKEKQLALRILINNKFKNTIVTENFISKISTPNTKILVNNLKKYNLDTNNNILIIVNEKSNDLYLSTRNLKNVELLAANHLNIVSLLKANHIIINKDALDIINKMYND